MDRDRSFCPTGRGDGDRWTVTVVLAQQGGIGREMDRDRSFSPTGGREGQMDRDRSYSTMVQVKSMPWTGGHRPLFFFVKLWVKSADREERL